MCVAPRGYVLCTWLRGIHCVPLRGATALRACSTTWARMATAGAANATAWALLARACDASHFHALAVLLLVDASQMFSLWLVRGCTVRSICHIKLTMLCVVGSVLSVVCCRHVRCEGLGSRGTCVCITVLYGCLVLRPWSRLEMRDSSDRVYTKYQPCQNECAKFKENGHQGLQICIFFACGAGGGPIQDPYSDARGCQPGPLAPTQRAPFPLEKVLRAKAGFSCERGVLTSNNVEPKRAGRLY